MDDQKNIDNYHKAIGYIVMGVIVALIAVVIGLAFMLEKMVDVNAELLDAAEEQRLTK